MLMIRKFLLLRLKIETNSLWILPCFILLLSMGNSSRASAQITPDATLPNNSVVIPDASGSLIEISEGTAIGNNLFHSFQEFSVISNQTVLFNNGLNIDNILTRITGNAISNIDGLMQANGTANLFLINPNGIVFGQNASLDIGGSFFGSTANSVTFSDGSEFSAIDPQAPPLLRGKYPCGFAVWIRYGQYHC